MDVGTRKQFLVGLRNWAEGGRRLVRNRETGSSREKRKGWVNKVVEEGD